jgi:hypothetical protein
MRSRLLIAAAFILIAGLSAGVTIYLIAEEPPPTAYLIVGDTAYPVDPASSKTYVRQIERFGGKTAVLFDELNRWFTSLWQGKRLGITLGALSALVAFAMTAIARRLPPDEAGDRKRST